MKKVSVFFGSDFLVAISVFSMVVIAIGGFLVAISVFSMVVIASSII